MRNPKFHPSLALAFVIVLHRRADQESHLVEVLARYTSMVVHTVKAGMRVEANVVYVMPPGFGVVLSGAGSDGTLELKAVKGEGGISVVQDPKTARFDGMPRNAIASGIADVILSPESVGPD